MIAEGIRRAGFTIIELLVVLGILAVITVVISPFLSTSVGKNELVSRTWELTGALRQAQFNSVTAHTNSSWGVHVQTDRFVLFRGTAYNVSDPDNVITMLPSIITLTMALNGGVADARFSKIRGETNDYGTITLTDSTSNEARTITITAVGVISHD